MQSDRYFSEYSYVLKWITGLLLLCLPLGGLFIATPLNIGDVPDTPFNCSMDISASFKDCQKYLDETGGTEISGKLNLACCDSLIWGTDCNPTWQKYSTEFFNRMFAYLLSRNDYELLRYTQAMGCLHNYLEASDKKSIDNARLEREILNNLPLAQSPGEEYWGYITLGVVLYANKLLTGEAFGDPSWSMVFLPFILFLVFPVLLVSYALLVSAPAAKSGVTIKEYIKRGIAFLCLVLLYLFFRKLPIDRLLGGDGSLVGFTVHSILVISVFAAYLYRKKQVALFSVNPIRDKILRYAGYCLLAMLFIFLVKVLVAYGFPFWGGSDESRLVKELSVSGKGCFQILISIGVCALFALEMELVFRSVLFEKLREILPDLFAAVMVSIFFSLIRFPKLDNMLYAFLASLILTATYVRFRTVWAPAIVLWISLILFA